jgi:DNA-binding NarL/FixJ family response regulator
MPASSRDYETSYPAPARSASGLTALIVTPRPLLGIGLQRVLSRLARMTVIGVVSDLLEVQRLTRRRWPDLIVVDAVEGANTRSLRPGRQNGRSVILRIVRASAQRDHATPGHYDAVLSENADAATLVKLVHTLFRDRHRAAPASDLTRRELDVVRLLARGERTAEIAEQLFISQNTVKTHLSHISRKLGLTRRVQIANWWQTAGDD